MSEHEPSPDPPAHAPVSRRFRGIRAALLLLVGVGALVGAYFAYLAVASSVAATTCGDNLKQIGRAFFAYFDQHGTFPPAFVRGKDGKPAHSWRVLILPFLGRQDLYDAYSFDEPWDGPNNIRLAGQMPDVFACPSGPGRAAGKTSYVAIVGSQTAWPGDRAVNPQELVRGSSYTLQLIEIADPDIGWTEPRDLPFGEILPPDSDTVGPRFAAVHKGGVHVLLCDGSVRWIKSSPTEANTRKFLYTVLTAWGGQPYKGQWLPGESPTVSVANFPAEQDATMLRATDVLPHPFGPVTADRNYVYCATFRVAWDDFRSLVGGDPQVEGRPPIATGLNGPTFPRASLSPAAYVAQMGLVSAGIRDRIVAEMGARFPAVKPSFSDAVGPDDVIAYAFLQKNLPFAARFDRIPEPLAFHATDGDAGVTAFGFKELAKAAGNPDKLKEQVEVLHYESDAEFILRLKPQADEIVLAKIRPEATLDETLQAAQRLIGTPPKKVDRPKVEDKEKLLIPRLALNVLRRYDELIGRRLENNGKQALRITEAKQAVRFLLNESGARLESEVELGGWLNGHAKPPPPPPPRMFVFDRPFLVYLKERTAEQPYLVIWVANAELMERRE